MPEAPELPIPLRVIDSGNLGLYGEYILLFLRLMIC
jgi:hypothetical protein